MSKMTIEVPYMTRTLFSEFIIINLATFNLNKWLNTCDFGLDVENYHEKM